MEYHFYSYNKVEFIEAKSNTGLKVIFSHAGASIREIYIDNKKITNNSDDDPAFLDQTNTYGKTSCGLNLTDVIISGEKYSQSEKMTLNNYLFAAKPTFEKNYFIVQYIFKKKHLSDGLPGTITYYVTYAMRDNADEIMVDYRAMSDKKTIINMTQSLKFDASENYRIASPNRIESANLAIEIIGDQHFESINDEIVSIPNKIDITPVTTYRRLIKYIIKR